MVQRNKANPRDGRVVPGQADEPAAFRAGDAAPPTNFDPAEVAEELNIWWENGGGANYILGDEKGGWSKWGENKVELLIKTMPGRFVASKVRGGSEEKISQVEQVLLHTMKERRVEMVMPGLAGYPAGINELRGHRILVKTEAKIVEPLKGEWETIKGVIETRLDLSRKGSLGIDQTPWFYAWLKVAYQSLVDGGPGNFQNGHAIIFAGPNGSAKGRLQHQIITGLLGGRSANAGPYLFSSTESFNGDLFEGEHLCVEEVPAPSQKMSDRVLLSEKIKQIVANDIQRLRRMREDPLTVSPYWRMSISINDDPDKMRSLPLITPDFSDKVLMFYVSKQEPLPMPTHTLDERRAFREAIANEMPAFAYWLMHEFEIPADLLKYPDGSDATRFGFKEFQHPMLVQELFEDTPHAELMMLIDTAEFQRSTKHFDPDSEDEKLKLWQLESWVQKTNKKTEGLWWGGSLELEQILKGEAGVQSSVAAAAKKLFAHNACSRLLSRLAKDRDTEQRVSKGDTKTAKGWKISRPIN